MGFGRVHIKGIQSASQSSFIQSLSPVKYTSESLEVGGGWVEKGCFGTGYCSGIERGGVGNLIVLSVVVLTGTLLLLLGELGGVGTGLSLVTLTVQADSLVDLVESLLDLRGHWGWGGNVISGGVEALVVSGVLNVDDLSLGGDVRVLALLDEDSSGQLLALVTDVSVLGGQDLVSGLVLSLVAAVISLLLVVLEDGDPGGGLLLLLLVRLLGGLLLVLLWLLSGLLVRLLRCLLLLVVLLLLELTLSVNRGGGQKAQGDLERGREIIVVVL